MDTVITYLAIGLIILFIIRRMIQPKDVNQISASDLKKELKLNKNQKQFIDVRTPIEYQGNHIKGFNNIPLQSLKAKLNELDKNKEVVVICQSGNRSMAAARILKKNGFEVTNVQGGMNAYR
ncbi:MAG: rhodanese-like domain-containing protein [Bacillaceae bacterium]|nr:rhodanese-like domain-containing protein [Bacillaceae bacterium]